MAEEDKEDLYAALGLEKGASMKDLQSAFRRMAKRYHPDVNAGEILPEFERMRLAYETLSNPETRRMYDEFGTVPGAGDDAARERAQAVGVITEMFVAFIKGYPPEAIARSDLMRSLKDMALGEIGETEETLSNLKRAEAVMKAHQAVIKRRLRHKRGGATSMFTDALDAQMRTLTMPRSQHEKKLKILKLVLEILEDYGFDFERATEEPTGGGGTHQAWTTVTFKQR